MKMKRFVSLVMACVMALALAVPAFAADPVPTGQVTIEGTYADVPIKVTVPTTGTAQINPYGLPVTITKSDSKTVDLVGQQVTSKPLSIKNQGAVKLDVNATLSVKPKGDVEIAAAKTTGKTIAVNLEVVGLDDEELAVSSESDKLEDLLIDRFAAAETWENAATLAAPAAAKDTAPATGPSKSDSAMAVLGAVETKSEGFNYGKDSIALFRLTGDVAEAPVNGTADDPWKAADGFTATIVFKFKPHVAARATVSMPATLNAKVGETAPTLTATFDAGESGLTVTKYTWSATDGDPAGKVTVVAGNTATATSTTVTAVTAGTATVICTATLNDNSTVTAECTVTVAAAD